MSTQSDNNNMDVNLEIYNSNPDDLWKEYDYIFKLETGLNQIRWTVFTALLSVSLLIGGIVVGQDSNQQLSLVLKAGIIFGSIIMAAAWYHYWWFHKKSEKLRDRMNILENKLGIRVFLVRTERPKLFGKVIYYKWAINAVAIAYLILACLVIATR